MIRALVLALLAMAGGCGHEPEASPSATIAGDPLLDPGIATKRAPDVFRARFFTTKGEFVIKATRKWSPAGVDRLFNLIDIGYFHDTPFYRVEPGFVAQFGFHWKPAVNAAWKDAFLPAERNRVSNMAGSVAFAQKGEGTRSTHLFVNLVNNAPLDERGFTPVAMVVEGMPVVQSMYSNYRDGPDQPRIASEGNAYLQENYPRLDYIRKVELLRE